MPTDTKLNQLIINQLTQEQYDEAKAAGTLSDTELYITDSDDDPQVKSNLSQTIDDSTTKYPSNKAVKDESSRITTLMDNKITNCLTKIPQDIKLELNNGTLTLKAGSKVYVPSGKNSDGSNKFDVVTIASDKVWSSRNLDYPQQFVFLKPSQEFEAVGEAGGTVHSGATAPSGKQFMLWYDTTNNFIKWTTDSGSTWVSGCSFAVSICSSTQANNWASIDQVFNGFGYIGSTVFALPGVKGLIPNGRNADGSLKSIEFVNDRVKTFTATESGYGLTYFLTPDYAIKLVVINSKAYAEKDTKLTTFDDNNGVWFDTKQNIMLETADSGTTWTRVNYVCFSHMFMTNTGHLDYLESKTVFHALDYNDKSTISGWSMPSSRYINLTLGASGSTYTAPANGWFIFDKRSSAAGQYVVITNETNGYDWEGASAAYGVSVECNKSVPVKKGDIIKIIYTLGGAFVRFAFIYAEGQPYNTVSSSEDEGEEINPGE